MSGSAETSVLSDTLSSGPKGLGDPDDKTLRRVEKEVLIPKIMRDIARKEKCTQLVKEFNDCCKDSSFLMVIKCRNQNNRMKECLTNWYNDESFKEECKQIYLKKRSEYRTTGNKEKIKRIS